MKPPPKILRPRYMPPPAAAASPWMKTIHLPAPFGALGALVPRSLGVRTWPWPIGPFVVPYIWSFQLLAWAFLATFWVIGRLLFAGWNWVGLPVLIFAWYRRQDRRARRHGGETVASALSASLPGVSHRQMTSHAVQALPAAPQPAAPATQPVPAPALQAGPPLSASVPDYSGVELVVGPDGSVRAVENLSNGQQLVTQLLPEWR